MPTCGDAKDMTGGCGLTSWFPGIASAMAGKDYQFYNNCAKGGGPECNLLHDGENIIKGAGTKARI
jgi:hypothetical protein